MVIRSLLKQAQFAVADMTKAANSKYGHMRSAYKRYESKKEQKDRIFFKTYPIESKGWRKVNIYAAGSTQLKWAIARAKRDGFQVSGANSLGYVVLFIKKAKSVKALKVKKAATKTANKKTVNVKRKTAVVRVSVNSKVIPVSAWYQKGMKIWRGLPMVQVFAGEKYTLQARFETDSEWEIARADARAEARAGKKVKLVLMENLEGDERLALYLRRK